MSTDRRAWALERGDAGPELTAVDLSASFDDVADAGDSQPLLATGEEDAVPLADVDLLHNVGKDESPITQQQLPTLSSEGKKRVSILSLVALNAAWIGVSSTMSALGIVLLPSQIRAICGDRDDDAGLAAAIVAGGLVLVLLTPHIGLMSDRAVIAFGRRRTFMLIGAVLIAVAELLMGITHPHKPPELTVCDDRVVTNTTTASTTMQPAGTSTAPEPYALHGNLAVFIILYVLAMFAHQLVGVPYNGLLADKTPANQRGVSSGIMAGMSVVGDMLGGSVGLLYGAMSLVGIYGFLSSLMVVSVGIVIVTQREEKVDPATIDKRPVKCSRIVKDFIDPLKKQDFRWVFLTRFLMQQGLSTVMYFLEYFFHDMVDLPGGMRAEEAVSFVLMPLLLCATASALVSGKISDWLGGRRRVLVVGAAMSMTAASLAMMFARSFSLCLVLAVVFGVGYGMFISVDFAMVLDVLPNEKERAKDLAVWHQALVLPRLLATPIGSLILHEVTVSLCEGGGKDICQPHCAAAYNVLFAISALYFVLSGVFVFRIKGVK